jgi:cysteine desulfurase
MTAMTYLDYNATAPVWPEVRDAMADALAVPGNASSVHGFGRKARAQIEDAREALAALVGAHPSAVVFTSGGTEANNLALRGVAARGGVDRVLVSAIEHPSVLGAAGATGLSVETVPVTRAGVVELDALAEALSTGGGRALVSVMSANNETGVTQPVEDVVALARAHEALVHVDAVQSLGRTDVDLTVWSADLVTLSAHKIGGPPGIGALVANEARVEFEPHLVGGVQERARRAGTENLAGIVGFGVAVALAERIRAAMPRVEGMRNALEARVKRLAPDVVVFGAEAPRLANTSAFAMPHVAAETQVMALDLAGVAVSAGAACSSGKVTRSHVLAAMGAGARASEAIRVSLGWHTTEKDIENFLDAYGAFLSRLHARPQALAVGG